LVAGKRNPKLLACNPYFAYNNKYDRRGFMKLGEKIAVLRKQRGLSQEDLANMMGISRQAISRWEQDENTPDVENIVQLSEIFNVSTDYLLRGMDAPLPPFAVPVKHKKRKPWLYRKLFANDFLYYLCWASFAIMRIVMGHWQFGWVISALITVWVLDHLFLCFLRDDDDDDRRPLTIRINKGDDKD